MSLDYGDGGGVGTDDAPPIVPGESAWEWERLGWGGISEPGSHEERGPNGEQKELGREDLTGGGITL